MPRIWPWNQVWRSKAWVLLPNWRLSQGSKEPALLFPTVLRGPDFNILTLISSARHSINFKRVFAKEFWILQSCWPQQPLNEWLLVHLGRVSTPVNVYLVSHFWLSTNGYDFYEMYSSLGMAFWYDWTKSARIIFHFDWKCLQLFEAVSGNAGVVHRDDRLSETDHGREALQTNVYLIWPWSQRWDKVRYFWYFK